MTLTCIRCEQSFESPTLIGYCPACVEVFAKKREVVYSHQRPAPGIFLDGKFTDECPKSFHVGSRHLCGLCGSDELEPGYGLGSGCGMGCYTFCEGCGTFLDFVEDTGE